jgi:hypothetical protein
VSLKEKKEKKKKKGSKFTFWDLLVDNHSCFISPATRNIPNTVSSTSQNKKGNIEAFHIFNALSVS